MARRLQSEGIEPTGGGSVELGALPAAGFIVGIATAVISGLIIDAVKRALGAAK